LGKNQLKKKNQQREVIQDNSNKGGSLKITITIITIGG